MLQILLPAWTVCLDLFFTAIAYGISGIRIPVRAACILSGTGAGCFLAAMELAKWSGLFLPASFCKLAGVVLLAAMGGAMLLKSFVEPADSSEKICQLPDSLFRCRLCRCGSFSQSVGSGVVSAGSCTFG